MNNMRHVSMRKNLAVSDTVGGGAKKVLYTLETMRQIGVRQTTKALTAHNTCKACALGMGGQRGGMVNELNEHPSVCNKSIQAQSTDIQPAIPDALFEHTLEDFKQLSPYELEHLGRLGQPIYKAPADSGYRVVSWDWAIQHIAQRFSAIDPQRSFFYSSGRSSNEAGFVLQLLARLYGTNNISNCSYYCHQATGEGLASTLGTGTATVELSDIENCDLFFLIGANPSSNHPRLLHKLKALRDRGGEVVVINPAKEPGLVKFALPKSMRSMLKGGDWIASEYLQPHIGTDLLLLKGLAKAVLELGAEDKAFVQQYTEGYQEFIEDVQQLSWEQISTQCGIDVPRIRQIAQRYAAANKVIFAWGMGVTQHLQGVATVEYIANLALMRGMVGRVGAGLLPLRGHSNVQGIGSMGVKPVLPEQVFAQIEREFGVELPQGKGLDTLAALQQAEAGEMEAALMLGGNLYAATPDSRFAQQALAAIDFKVFLTTTLNQGHLFGAEQGESMVLPVTARDEEWQPTTQESMFNYVRMSDGGIRRLDNVRPESNILCAIASQLLPDSPIDFDQYKSHHKIRQAIANTIPGMEQIADIDAAKREFHVARRVLHQPRFNRPNQKAAFQTRVTPPEKANVHYPLRLMTVRSEGQYNSIIYEQRDSYRGAADRWSVLMSPEQMQQQGLQAGDKVNLVSATGRMDKVTVYGFDLPQGNLMAYYPEANILVSQQVDSRSRTPAFKSVAVYIENNKT